MISETTAFTSLEEWSKRWQQEQIEKSKPLFEYLDFTSMMKALLKQPLKPKTDKK